MQNYYNLAQNFCAMHLSRRALFFSVAGPLAPGLFAGKKKKNRFNIVTARGQTGEQDGVNLDQLEQRILVYPYDAARDPLGGLAILLNHYAVTQEYGEDHVTNGFTISNEKCSLYLQGRIVGTSHPERFVLVDDSYIRIGPIRGDLQELLTDETLRQYAEAYADTTFTDVGMDGAVNFGFTNGSRGPPQKLALNVYSDHAMISKLLQERARYAIGAFASTLGSEVVDAYLQPRAQKL